MRFRVKLLSPIVFISFASLLLLFSLIHFLTTPRSYSVPTEQLKKPLWRTWGKEWKRGEGEEENWWDGKAACNGGYQEDATKPLQYREDGSFRIAIFTDLHFSCGHTCSVDHQTQLLVDSVLEMERPDLVVFNGDQIQSEGGSKKSSIFLDVLAPAERRGIPFAVIFGNHDSDGPNVLSREAMVHLAQQCPHSITMSPTEFRENSGAYIRAIEGGETTHLLFLDTNRDVMTSSQMTWLRASMNALQTSNHADILATLFSFDLHQDIPSKEFITKMCSRDTVCNGMYGERTEFGGKDVDTGFYDLFQEFKGQVRAIVSGHDHKNDLCSVSNADSAIEVLCYARASGYPLDKSPINKGYGHDTLTKGARVIHMNHKTNSLFTYIVNDVGEREHMLHFISNNKD